MTKVLFVCLGNICRSPAAEGIFSKLLCDGGFDKNITCDSAGTSAYHAGERADARMREHAARRGFELTSIARRFDSATDFKEFDYIIAMDESNHRDILNSAGTDADKAKVYRMVEFCTDHKVDGVPDPYFDGDRGFELVLDIVEDGCRGLLAKINAGQK